MQGPSVCAGELEVVAQISGHTVITCTYTLAV